MEPKEIKALVDLMREQGLVELEIEDKKGKIRLVRASNASPSAAVSIDQQPARKSPPSKTARAVRAAKATSASVPELAPDQKLVASPMVGTFYRASAPDAAPFVEEGDSVRKGQPLCIIEAMKMMNEIEAEVAGRVVKILCENGQPVEYGQPLMILLVT